MIGFFVLSLLAVSFAIPEFSTLESSFSLWTQLHGKEYDSQTEYLHRMAIFAVNLERVNELNEESNGGAIFEINKFADLTPAEFKAQYLGYVPTSTEKGELLTLSGKSAAPDTYTWLAQGKVTPVKDQKQCGSCWAFSATENIESVWLIAKGLTADNLKPLAPQQIVDCDKQDGGCNGGDTPTAYKYVESAGGMETEADYPYKAVNQACKFNKADVYVTISGYKRLSKDENDMKEATATVAPLSICVDAEPWQHYKSGVMTRSQCGTSLDHCVQIEGYNTSANPPYWNVRNSWGVNWGEKGYIRLEFGTNTCGLAEEATTAVV